MEKGVQVCVKSGKTLKKNCFSQTDLSCFDKKEAETQCSVEKSSYTRSDKLTKWTYHRLKDEVLCRKDITINWCMKEGLIARERVCGHCNERMKLVECTDRSDGYKWNVGDKLVGRGTRLNRR